MGDEIFLTDPSVEQYPITKHYHLSYKDLHGLACHIFIFASDVRLLNERELYQRILLVVCEISERNYPL